MSVQEISPALHRFRSELRLYWEADHGRLIHAFKTAFAVILGLGISMRLELPPPRTALVSIVIIMQHQQAGMVIARGFYRGLGMIVGSVAGFLLVAVFPQEPLPFAIALSLWIGMCVWGAAYYRNFQSYGFVLAGYATAITAVPAWVDPYGIFDSVVYSLSEVTIGVVCASLVSALILPQHVGAALFAAGQRHFGSFMDFVRRMLRDDLSSTDIDAIHLKLIGERAQIDSLRSAAVFEDPELRLRSRLMVELNQDFLDASAGFHAMRQIRSRAAALSDARALTMIDQLYQQLDDVLPEIASGTGLNVSEARSFLSRLQVMIPGLPKRIEMQLAELEDASTQTRQTFGTAASALYFAVIDLCSYIENFIAIRDPVVDRHHPITGAWKIHTKRIVSTANRIAANAAGLRALIAVLIVTAFWIASGWTGGSSAVIGVAITSALFAVAPQPAIASRQIFLGCLAGWLTAFAFNFYVLPRLDGFVLLAVCLAPVIMVGSYINTFPRTAVFGLGFNIYFCFIGNITNPSLYDPAAFLDLSFSLMVGIASAAFAFSVIVPYAGEWVTARYVNQIRREAAQTACLGQVDDLLLRFESSMRDFVILIAARPAGDQAGRKTLFGWAFAALEVGRAVIQLREDAARPDNNLPPGWESQQHEWLIAIAQLFEQVTPERHDRALRATRHALDMLPIPTRIEPSFPALSRFRMRALLHFTELSLLDETLPLKPSVELS
ncbi:MAG: FUSC family protein [Rhodanobacter sp.]